MKEYDHKKIEKKWQTYWDKKKLYKAEDFSPKPKFYCLIEFPFPSGEGVHTGHLRSNTAMDIIARKRRSEGYNVLYPIGWDAFGLPTENYAIKTGLHPKVVTKQNTDNFRKQLKSAGFSFDWSREINTSDPAYYKWTQWIFLKMFEKGLAHKKKMVINWCPKDKIGLANEEVIDGCCERCGTPVEKREKEQWMLKITEYADRLDKDLDTVDYLPKIKIQQRNWIGKSEGAEFEFGIVPAGSAVKVFTTRADTFFGVTYIVLAPEHELVQKLKGEIKNWSEVEGYIKETQSKKEIERVAEDKEKTGVELRGVFAVHPATKEKIPVWIADYVLSQYGTGAVMAVPAHDDRDFAFAKKYGLPVKEVVKSIEENKIPYCDYGITINSEKFNDLSSEEAKKKMTESFGSSKVTYKLRDWIFSRQRYWGEPIPMVYCSACADWVPVPEKDLPVKLPEVKNYQPTDTGESPLASMTKWVNTKCPKCKGPARRETDTMPNWAGSSWYYLRYVDAANKKSLAAPEKLKYWTPVDWYNGGMEHTTLHLLYSRFWHKFLFDIGIVPTSEPYKKRTSHGLILAAGGEKMSKSKGNVVNPDGIIEAHGADTLRLYEMFMGPFDQPVSWSMDGIVGPRRFLERVWKMQDKITPPRLADSAPLLGKGGVVDSLSFSKEGVGGGLLHQTIKKVSEDIESMQFNTAISALMILSNDLEKQENISAKNYEIFIKLLSPFAPHITEELWLLLGHKTSIHLELWPQFDASKIKSARSKIVVQVNGKVRGQFEQVIGMVEDEVKKIAIELPEIKKWIDGKEIKKVIYVDGKLVNIVTN